NGWKFPADASEVRNGSEPDPLYGAKLIRELYLKADPSFAGRWTVPLLWDKKQHTAVNNESADTIRIFNTAFNHLLPEDKKSLDLYPEALRSQIDEANEWLADIIRNTYPAIIGATEEDKAAARAKIYALFDRLEGVLSKTKYAVGNEITEADVRVYPWILRFSITHHALFPAGSPSIEDKYPAILAWLRRIYQRDGVSETVNVGQIQGIVLGNPSFVKAIPDGFAFPRGPVLSEPIVA
ncbi:glutathione S-transferase, partial [Ramicandelaber brevisporus]